MNEAFLSSVVARSTFILVFGVSALICRFDTHAQNAANVLQVLTDKSHHLGNTVVTNWPETTNKPEAAKLELRFEAEANSEEMVLGIKQRDVSAAWQLKLNGKRIANLKMNKEPQLFYYPVPANALLTGENTLSIETTTGDDIAAGPITLHRQELRQVLGLQTLAVSVNDKRTGQPLPARITVTDFQLNLVDLHKSKLTGDMALRRGLLYTRGTPTWFELAEGEYLVFATRGMEWSRAEKKVSVRKGRSSEVRLSLEREVDTTGFIAADTHIHTVTFSGHGDASIDERMLTIAGEGVEMAVSTDHNHQTDYRSYQEKLQVTDYFTPVTGNEVTTPAGHVNAFPLGPKDEPPAHRLNDWVQIVDGIRAKGAQMVILNHPRWPTLANCPFTKYGLNRISGDFREDVRFVFDGVELANSLVPQPDPLYIIEDWLALLNAGHKITGVGASDTHTVGEPVGMARSYIPSLTDDPTQIDVTRACEHFRRGETSVSLGIFADVLVDGRFKMGNTNSLRNEALRVRLRVAAPSWVNPQRALIYLNGQVAVEKPVLSGSPKRPTNTFLEFKLKRPANDAHLVCVVLGDGALHPSWKTKERFTLAATNPVFLDGDGDGQYASPRAQALTLLNQAGNSPAAQWEALNQADDAVAVQMLSVMRQTWPESEQTNLEARVREAAAKRPVFREYLANPLPLIRINAGQLK